MAQDPASHVGPEPEAAGIEEQGLGWKSSFKQRKRRRYAIGSGIEGAWKANPTKWDMGYLKVRCSNTSGSWSKARPAQINGWPRMWPKRIWWWPRTTRPQKLRPMMTTADLSLRFDPIYETNSAELSGRTPSKFADAFARAWFKLTHRDMGPRPRYLGPEVPAEELIWQDPIPAVTYN